MLISGVYRKVTYGYLFFVFFLWLGFWFKFTVHQVLDYSYVEPIGGFSGSASSWDDVLMIATIAAIGVISARLSYFFLSEKSTFVVAKELLGEKGAHNQRNGMISRYINRSVSAVPEWYPSTRIYLWMTAFLIVILTWIANIKYGIQNVGLVPRTILFWPLNAVISYVEDIGAAMIVAMLVWWDFLLKKAPNWSIAAILGEAIIASISIWSRGVYLFHAVPQLLSLFLNQKLFGFFSPRRAVLTGVAGLTLLLLSIPIITTFRSYSYPHKGGWTFESQKRLIRIEVLEGGIAHIKRLIARGEHREAELQGLISEKTNLERLESIHSAEGNVILNKADDSTKENTQNSKTLLKENALSNDVRPKRIGSLLGEFKDELMKNNPKVIIGLSIDRWVGLEGVMAVSAYPLKGRETFFTGLQENGVGKKPTIYQYISNSSYRYTDSEVWKFATLPGLVAFLYFSGSKWVVFLGMLIGTLLLFLWERFIFGATRNPLMCSLLGFVLANNLAQFGVAPRSSLHYFLMIVLGVFAIWVLRSYKMAALLVSYKTRSNN